MTIPAAQAAALLRSLKCTLSRSLHAEVQQAQPQVVQVWFEPSPKPVPGNAGQTGPPANVRALDGRAQVSPQILSWASSHAPNLLLEALREGGRVLIRVHCGLLYDARRRPFSAALDAIVTLESLRLPGGVMETWFFVKG